MGSPLSDLRWFHVMGNTYGTWLRGDRRGWRARHHREHVDGDYRNPPPSGKYDWLQEQSRRLMTRSPVRLTSAQREIGGRALVEKLLELHVQLLALSLGRSHFHRLGKFPPPLVRKVVGFAKRNAAFRLRAAGLEGGVWAVRCKVEPIRDRAHQLNTFQYVLNHVNEGARVWDFRANPG